MIEGTRSRDPLLVRVMIAARENGIRLRADGRDDAETAGEMVADLINMEWVATDRETGETARGESPRAAWANLRDVPKRGVHAKIARWHASREST